MLSGAFHVVCALVFTAASMYQPQIRILPVTVVDLVGGGEIMKAPQKTPAAKVDPPADKNDPPDKKVVEKDPPKVEEKKAPEVDPNSLAQVSDRVSRMRQERENADSVRKAIETRRREAAAREAVRGVKERMGRRIESPSPASQAQASGTGGSQGAMRISPEMMEFFRLLEERIRESWILPDALAPNTSGLMVEVRITIEKDGRVSSTTIERGSGSVYFDESVRRAIGRASPLPIPPERLRGGEDHYEVGFRFHGTGSRV